MGKETELLHAVRDQNMPSLYKLLGKNRASKTKLIGSSKKINVNYKDADGMAALHQAALVGNQEILRMLIDNGASVDIKDSKGMRALHYAAWQGKEQSVDFLLLKNSSAKEAAIDGNTPLHLACEHGQYDVVQRLLQHGADPTIYNKQRKTPLDLACEFGKFRVVEFLLQTHLCDRLLVDCPQDANNGHRTTCLHLAARNGHSDIIRLLVQAGVDINRQTMQGTCLHEAALYGKTEVVKLLLDFGVDVNRPNANEQTALDIVNKFTASRAAKELKHLLRDASETVLVRAVTDYHNPNERNHLTFKQGDLLTVVAEHPSGMWKGHVSSSKGNHVTGVGYFPASHVVLVDSHGQPMTNKLVSSQSFQQPSSPSQRLPGSGGACPDLLPPPKTSASQPSNLSNGGALHVDMSPFGGTVGTDGAFPPPPSPVGPQKTKQTSSTSSGDSDRDSGISPQQCTFPPQVHPGSQGVYSQAHQAAPSVDRTAEWLGRLPLDDSRSASPCHRSESPAFGHRRHNSSSSSSGQGSGGFLAAHLNGLNAGSSSQCSVPASASQPHLQQHSPGSQQQHRLSGQSYESGVSGVSGTSSFTSRQSYHSNSSSSLGSLDRLEESGYASTINVHELFQAGLADEAVLRAWLADLHFEEYLHLFVDAGYDMPTISRMTPEDLTAVGITKPAHRKRLKAELSKLHIHDGIPDFKPVDVAEWLQLLNLMEYTTTLLSEGYSDIDTVTDITWEDLEEIGIKRLGHQKKIMLAIDRLKRLHSSSKRLSSVDRRASGELLEPASSFPTPKWLEGGSSSPGPPAPPPHSQEHVLITRPRRSPSGDNLSSGELRTFQQAELPSEAVQLRGGVPAAGQASYQPDIVAIQVHRNVRNSNTSGDSAYESEGSNGSTQQQQHSSFQAPRDAALPEGDATPTNERREIPHLQQQTSSDDSDNCSTLRRPSAKVSPRISPKPKPKPVAKIVAAKVKRISREMPTEIIKPLDRQDDSSLYSSNTLPRKSSRSSHSEHIYDQPAGSKFNDFVCSSSSQSSAPNSPAHHTVYAQNLSPGGGAGRAKRPPPPPPKRTNSIKSDAPLLRSFADRKTSESSSVVQPQQTLYRKASEPPPMTTYTTPSTAAVKAEPRTGISTGVSTGASTGVSTGASTGGTVQRQQRFNFDAADNPLNAVIQQLEDQGKDDAPAASECSAADSSGDDSDTGGSTLRRRQQQPQHRKSTGSIASTGSDTNTLPFANENVGTIKQRNPSTKTSIVSVSGEGDERHADLNAQVFDDDDDLDEEETSTMKRKPKRVPEKKVPPPAPPKRKDSVGAVAKQQGNSSSDDAEVFNDIDNMLQDLTMELDAMLDDVS